MPRVKHIHSYTRVKGKFSSIWKCADGDCNHFVYQAQDYIVKGRNSICWECGRIFSLTELAMQEDNPRCDTCRYQGTEFDSPLSALESLKKASND